LTTTKLLTTKNRTIAATAPPTQAPIQEMNALTDIGSGLRSTQGLLDYPFSWSAVNGANRRETRAATSGCG
jgi:hypothetical protein